jgi:hypothetical protein
MSRRGRSRNRDCTELVYLRAVLLQTAPSSSRAEPGFCQATSLIDLLDPPPGRPTGPIALRDELSGIWKQHLAGRHKLASPLFSIYN